MNWQDALVSLIPVVGERVVDEVAEELQKLSDDADDPVKKLALTLMIEAAEEKGAEGIQLAEKAIKDFGVIDMSIIHRVGPIDIGENIVLIIAVGEHRGETFKACEWAIAELKRTTPIWKRETTTKGEVWVQDTP